MPVFSYGPVGGLTSLLVLILCTCAPPPTVLSAQVGLHPPSVDWQQIEVPEGRIIFPKGYEARAERIATLIELLEAKHTGTIGARHYPFDLVLQTTNTTVNGFVALAPFRSEFFLTPPQDQNLLSTTDWVDLLTIHEYRHVQQNSNERRGITRLASYLFGQQGWAGTSFLATPNWFSEGDAVIFETALSPAGRGRTPAFSGPFRSLLQAGIVYPYRKARNGSLRDLVPDHYRYGYAMLTYGREHYGHDMWKSVLHDGASYKGLFYPFSRALRRKTGLNTRQLYAVTLADMAAKQDSALAARGPFVAGRAIGQDHRSVVDYRFPHEQPDGSTVALRSGFEYRPALVRLDPAGGKDERLMYVGIQREPWVDVRGDRAVWMEDRLNPRYTNERYSEIVVADLRTGKRRQLTRKGKFFAPALHPSRPEIVAVVHDPLAAAPALVVLSATDGREQGRWPLAASALLQPRFSEDGQTIFFLHQNFQGIAIQALDRKTAEVRTIRPRTTENIDQLRVAGEYLTFSSGRDGVDNVYRYGLATGALEQLTREAIGALYPRLTKRGLLYVSPTPRGLRPRLLAAPKAAGLALPAIAGGPRPVGPSFYERANAFAEETIDLSAAVQPKTYQSEDVSDKLYGFRLHSWGPVGTEITPGLALQGGNALNTIQGSASATYNRNTREISNSITMNYGGWWPVLSVQGVRTGRRFLQLDPALDSLGRLGFTLQDTRQISLGAMASVPLRWVHGEFSTRFTPRLGLSWFSLGGRTGEVLPGSFLGAQVGAGLAVFRRRARAQVQSTLGGLLSVQYDRGLANNTGQRLLLNARVQLPGLARTHGLRFEFEAIRQETTNPYQYADGLQYPRGYDPVLNDAAWRIGADYQLPIAYPEWGFAGIYYLKRLRFNSFADHGGYRLQQLAGTATGAVQRLTSVGGQLFFDSVFFNSTPDISFGVEWALPLRTHALAPDIQGGRWRLLALTLL